MATKYDLELLCSDLESLLISNLNTKIGVVNTEKNDTITLKTVDDSAYFFQELNGKQVNYNPFVLYGIEGSTSLAERGGTIEMVTISVIIVIEDDGQDIAIMKRMLRYRRCLKEIIQDNFLLATNSNSLKIQSLVPVAFQGINSSENYRAVGINIMSTIDS